MQAGGNVVPDATDKAYDDNNHMLVEEVSSILHIEPSANQHSANRSKHSASFHCTTSQNQLSVSKNSSACKESYREPAQGILKKSSQYTTSQR